jgi:hypothetical protein
VDLEEHEAVDPVIERRCAECGTPLTKQEIQAALDSDGPFLCTIHAQDRVPLDDAEEMP